MSFDDDRTMDEDGWLSTMRAATRDERDHGCGPRCSGSCSGSSQEVALLVFNVEVHPIYATSIHSKSNPLETRPDAFFNCLNPGAPIEKR